MSSVATPMGQVATHGEAANLLSGLAFGTLTASIAHEVNQPLSGIIMNARTCLRMLSADPPNIDGALETARRTIRDGNRATEVIARLRLLFTKRSSVAEPVDLNVITRESIGLSADEIERNGVIVCSELADGLPLVNGDAVQLQEVILNLIRNAVDAMEAVEGRPRQLVIRTERGFDNHVRLSVQDSGVGFNPQTAERLFEQFYTTKSGGMGIGLFVSRTIIENHRGSLLAVPNDVHGATFSFSVPCAPQTTTNRDRSSLH